MPVRVWTEEEIAQNLRQNDNWVIRGILVLYKLQTSDEQDSMATRYSNMVGFNAVDANLLTSFAKQIVSWNAQPRFRKPLSERQMKLARERVIKYRKQLLKIANGEIQVPN